MFQLALLTFYRSFMRHRLYAALSVGGLAIGLAVFLVISLYVRHETSFESWLPHADQIYLVESRVPTNMDLVSAQSTPLAVWPAVAADLPNTVGTRIDMASATVIKDGVGIRERLARVDPSFFAVFGLPVVAGDVGKALANPTNVILTDRSAQKYFGGESAVGKTLSLTANGHEQSYTVAAVLADLPTNSDFRFDLITRLVPIEDKTDPDYKSAHQWNFTGASTYVRLPDEAAATRFESELAGVVARHAKSETPDADGFEIKLLPRPLRSIHFEKPGSQLAVTTLAIVGALTLLIAIVNYVNLATARAGLRAREVAMRKVLGASRSELIRQFLIESVATVALAALVGLALAELCLPLVNAAGGTHLVLAYVGQNGILLPMLAVVVLVGLLAGVYPAFLLSRFPAAEVLASSRHPGGGRASARGREVLVVVQFAIATAFLVGTLVLVTQTRHVRTADLGFDRRDLMLVPSLSSESLSDGQRDSFVHRLAALPGVTSVGVGNSVPGGGFFSSSANFSVPGVSGPGPSIQFFDATPGFFRTVGARLLAGRLFDAARAGDANPNLAVPDSGPNGPLPANVVLNLSASRALGYPSAQAAVGQTFGGDTPRTVIGVIDDMRFGSPRAVVVPTLYDFQPRQPDAAIGVIRFTGDAKAMLEAVRQAWMQEMPEVPFDAATADQRLAKFYADDEHAAALFIIGALLAVAIGCVGLWGLASFNAARRTREIGIRKTLGASSRDILRLLIGQFLRPVLLANVLAWPLAYFATRSWLAGFDDRIALTPLFFVGASLLSLAIATSTVLVQALRAARATPAWALRHD